MSDVLIPLREVCKLISLTPATIRSWGKKNKIKTFTTPTNQTLYSKQHVQELASIHTRTQKAPSEKQHIIYCRVSSKGQTEDLARQVDFLKSKYPTYRIITDCASGLNFNRKGLKTILELAMSKTIGDVVVAYKDRLSRFGFDLINSIVSLGGGNIRVVNKENKLTITEQEMAEDLLSIIHIYNCRQMGKRRYAKTNIPSSENTTISITTTEANIKRMDGHS